MTSRERNVLSLFVKALCIAAVTAMAAVSVLLFAAPLSDILFLAGFAFVYVQLPGLLLLRAIGFCPSRFSTRIAIGFFTGWAFELAVYFISDLMPGDLLLYACGPLLSVVYTVLLVKDRRDGTLSSRISFRRLPALFFVFFALILFYCLVNTQYLYPAPAVSAFTYMNPDKAYHMGLINALSHDYPLQSPWIAGVYINYHIFSEMLFSIPVRLFDIPADVITQSFGPFLTAFVFGISLYSFFREMSSKPERAGLYCLLVVLANIYVTRSATTSLAFHFILINDNSAGYGMAAALMTIVLFSKWYDAFARNDASRWKLLVLLSVFIMLTAGIKGPMGAVTVAAMWGVFLLGVILRKVPPKVIIPLMLVTACFLVVYVTVLGSRGQSNASGNSVITFGTITDIAFWKRPLIDFLKSAGIPRSVRLGFILAAFMVFFLTAFFVPFCIGYIRELFLVLSGRKPYEPARVLVYAEWAVGIIALFFLNYSGHSQAYFGLVSAFLSPVIAFWFIEDLEEKAKEKGRTDAVLKATLGITAACLILTTVSLFSYYGEMINEASEKYSSTDEIKHYLNISNAEYEAMVWLEENTEDDALLAADRYYSVPLENYDYNDRWDNRYFLYPVYSNRYTYITGSGYNLPAAEWETRKEMIETNNELYDAGNEERGDIARDLGVDYVLVSKRFTDSTDLSNRDYELCFSNEDMDIYKIAE